jgi:carboxymethylenebutenolidase
MPASWVDINVGDGSTMEAYLTQPEGDGNHPAVVVIQEIWGVNSHIQAVADRLPSQGYVGLAPAMFHRQGSMIAGLHEELQTAVGRMQQCNDAGIMADVTSAVNFLKGQSSVNGKIGIVGFCFGGRVAYLAACNISDLSASVVFYGGNIGVALGDGQTPLEQTGNINCPVLGLFGEEDANPTPDFVNEIDAEMTRLSKAHEFHQYAGAGHGFHCEARGSYRPEAAQDAWGKAMAWFDQNLKS